MWRFLMAAALLVACLGGCSSGNDLEKDILGHPVPPAPSNGRFSTPPPPSVSERPLPPPQAQSVPVSRPAPAVPPAPAAPVPPVAHHPNARGMARTFQVGSFAHMENAKHLADSLTAKGFTTRLEKGTLHNRPFVMVYASKRGSRAALEGELFACGVTEPVLTGEGTPRPPAGKAPAVRGRGQAGEEPSPSKMFQEPAHQARASGKAVRRPTHAKSAKASVKARSGSPRQTTPRPTPSTAPRQPATPAEPRTTTPSAQPATGNTGSRVTGTQPVVEPAPALPDGYVPPPPKASGSSAQ